MTDKRCKNKNKCLTCEQYSACCLSQRDDFTHLAGTIWYNCRTKKDCICCEKIKQCRLERGLEWRQYGRRNVIVNLYPDRSKNELIFYKQGFLYLEESENRQESETDRRRKFVEVAKGVYAPLTDDVKIKDLQRSIRNAEKRSLDSFYGYAKANDWHYFITLTFSPEIVDRYNDNAVKELWSEFQRWCVRRSPGVKILVVPERHKDRAIHFHGLVANIEFDLELAKDPRTGEYLKTKFGDPLFTIKNWKNGISTLAVIPQEDNYNKVINYMQKYVTKDTDIGYCKKRYYRTRNLLFKDKAIEYLDDDELNQLVTELGYEKMKENDKMIVFRPRSSDQ